MQLKQLFFGLIALLITSFTQAQTFTYQGFIRENGVPANGTYPMTFRLFQSETGGAALVTLSPMAVPVVNGLFTRELNFGPVWIGNNYWLEIQIGSTILTPRIKITPTPYAYTAMNALALQGRQVSSAPPTLGQILKWNNNTWAPTDDLRDEFWQSSGNNIYYSSGNVGIGVVNPLSKLHVVGGLRVDGNIQVSTGSSILGLNRVVGLSTLRLAGDNNPNGSWDLEITSNGIIGHRSTYSNVNFNIRNSGYTFAFNVEDTSGTNLFSVLEDGVVRAAGLRNIGDHRNMQWNQTSNEIGWDTSSRRYKTNITLLEDDFLKILLLEPKTYTRLQGEPNRWEIGYIAEELHDLGLTRLVEYDPQGRPDGVNYEKMVLYLNEVIKRQQTEIKRQNDRTTELEKRLAQLESLLAKPQPKD